ncbi:MAG: hypothetical protein AAFQ98_11190 [Bacteroidota bacterium]
MKLKVMSAITFLLVATACNESNLNNLSVPDGEYSGVFERNGTRVNVELSFDNGVYSGASETEKFPAICDGEYSVANQQIQFSNECIWTTEFDWTLILDGSWEYTLEGNSLVMTKENGDSYTLTKQ